MAPSGGQTTVGLTVAANMDVSGILNGVKSMQGAFNGLKLPANLTGDAIKQFDKLKESLTKYRELMEKGPSTKADLKQLEKLEKTIKSSFSDLSKIYDEFSNKKIYLEADATAIKNAQKDIDQLKQDVQNKLGSIKFEFSSPTKGKVDIGLNDLVSDMERAVKSSKTVSASMKEMTNSVKSGNFTNAAKGLVQIEQQASKLKGASIGLLKTFQQMGLIQFNKSAEDLYKSGQHVTLLHQGFEKLRGALSADDAELKQFVKSLEDAVTKKGELEKIGETNYRNSLSAEKQNIDGLAQGYNQCADAARGFAQQTLSATQQVEQLQQSTQYFFSLRNMINLLKRGIDEAVQSVKDLDKAMTETAVVTDYKVSDLWGMLPEYTKVANDLGATTQGAYETMTLYYQQGLEQQQAFELGAETMKMARIAGLDYAETTDMMTAALRGFNMELNEVSAKRVNDVYSELAAITASDTEELGTAMQRTASIAASAGASFEGTTAFLAQAIETTREPAENIGTAMKTIVARFQELKKNPLEISEVEGEEVDYNKIDTALKTIGVDLKDANGQFRDFDQVMLDISARWDGLSQAQQRYIATTAAGSRQQSRFIAMVSNYDRTMQLMEAANNSAGASDEQFGKTMDSLESKLNKLHNAWQQFTMGIANNGMIKLAVDGLTGFLNVTNKIIDTLSLGSGVFKSFLSIFAAFTGLKVAGRAANSLIGGLGGLVDPQSTVKEGLKAGLFGQGKNAAQAKAITTPIVGSLSKISGQIAAIAKRQGINDSGQKGNTAGITQTSKEDYANTKRLFSQLSGKEGFKMGDTSRLFGNLDAKHQLSMFNNSPGTKLAMKQASLNWFNSKGLSKELTNEGKQFINSIYKGMSQGQIPVDKGIELIGQPQKWGQYFGTDMAKGFSSSFARESTQQAHQQAMQYLVGNPDAYGFRSNEFKDWYNNQATDAQKEAYAKYFRQAIDKRQGLGEAKGKVSDLGRLANDIGSVGDKFTQAGYGISTFGNALSQLGGPLGAIGTGIAAFGSAISSMGMMVSGATSLITVFSEGIQIAGTSIAISGGAIAAVAAPLAAAVAAFLLVRAHLKKVKEAGEEVTNTFNETNKTAEDNIAKLKSYQSEFATLSKGVDANGNNVSLDDSQYQRYLEIVDDIAAINPDIVEGYNAQGHAIINNNKALAETLKTQQEIRDEARNTYTSNDSLQKLINARNINNDFKAINVKGESPSVYDGSGHGSEGRQKPVGLGKDVATIADRLRLIKDFDESSLQKYGINSLDSLLNGEEQAVKNFIKHRQKIEEELSNSGLELNDAIINGFDKLGEDAAAFDAAIQPVYDNLLANVSNSKAFESIAPEFRNALNMGLKDLASQDLSASEMSRAATTMATKFANLTTGSGKYQEAMDKVADAQEKFAANLEETEYKANVQPAIDDLVRLKEEALKEGGAYGDALAEYLENQIEQIANFTEQGTTTIQEGLNTATDAIAQAESALENFNEATKKDFSTAAEGMRSIYDKIFETYQDSYGNELEKHTEGEGDNTFWTGAEALLSEDKLAGGVKEVTKSLKELEPWLREGKEGMDAFFTDVINNENLKKLEKDGLISLDENDWFKEIPEDQWNAVADALGISEDLLTSMLNKARQFGLIEFDNLEKVREALATSDSAITGVESNAQGQKALYIKEDTMRQNLREAGYNTKESQDKVIERLLKEQNVNMVKTMENINKDEAKTLTEAWGIKDLPDLITKMSETGDYSREEILDIAEKAGLGSGEAAADVYDKVISALDNPELAAQTSELQSINAKLGAITDHYIGKGVEDHEAAQQKAHEAALGENGIATNFAKGLDAEGKVLDTGSFAVVRDELEKTQAQYEESAAYYRERAEIADDADKKRFNDLADLYEADAAAVQKAITQGEKAKKKLKDDAEDRKGKDKLKRDDSKYSTQPDVNKSRDEGRKQHREVVEDVQTNKEETTTFKAKTDSSFTKVQKEAQKLTGLTEEDYTLKLNVAAEQLDKAREDIYLVQSTVDENLLLVCDADTSEVIATQQKIVDTQNLANKGVVLNSKGNTAGIDKVKGALSTVAGKTFSAAITVATGNSLSVLEKIWNLIQKIKNNNPGGGSKGTPNAGHRTSGPQQFATGARNHGVASIPIVGSAARGGYGRIGPKGKGGPTLTGELGYEVAWLPSENRSMILGANGPQMINLPGDAVVWTHEQSKKILKQKAISAGSLAYATGDSSGYVPTYPNGGKASGGGKGGKGNSNTNRALDKASKKVTDTSKKAYGWWAKMERHVKNLDTATDRLRKKIDKMMSDLRMIADDFIKVNSKYEKMLKDQIKTNQKMVDKASTRLKKLDTNKATVTAKVENSKGKPKNKKFKVGKYIKQDSITGEYEIDRKAWNKVYNKKGKGKEGKALLEALEKELDKWTDRKNTAQDNVDEANDALQEFKKDFDDMFYGWENELTKIYTLTTDIELLEAKIANEQKKAALSQAKIKDFNYILGNLGDVTGRTKDQPAGSLMAEFNKFLASNKEQLKQTELLQNKNRELLAEYDKEIEATQSMNDDESKRFAAGLQMDEKTFGHLSEADKRAYAKGVLLNGGHGRSAYYQNGQFDTAALEADRRNGLVSEELYNGIKEAYDKITEAELNRVQTEGAILDAEADLYDLQQERIQLAKELYEQLYGWKNELNRIFILSQQIADAQARTSRYQAQTDLMESKLTSGMQQFSDEFNDEMLYFFKANLDASGEAIEKSWKSIEEQTSELGKEWSSEREKKEYVTLANQYNDATEARYYREQAELAEAAMNAVVSANSVIEEQSDAISTAESNINKANKQVAKDNKQIKKDNKTIKAADKAIKAANKVINSKTATKAEKKEAKADKKEATKDKKAATKDKKAVTADKKEQQQAIKTNAANIEAAAGVIASNQAIVDSNTEMASHLDYYSDQADATAANWIDDAGYAMLEARKVAAEEEVRVRDLAHRFLTATQMGDGTMKFEFDSEGFEALRGTEVTTEMANRVTEYVKKLIDDAAELNNSYTEITNRIKELYDGLRALKETMADNAESLLNAYTELRSKEINRIKTLVDSINSSLKDLLDQVKKTLDERRRQEDNAKTETTIGQQQNRLAAMRANTASGNQVTIAQLQKELADSQQSYGRTLEDQLIQRLQEGADAAYKQRQRQITLLSGLLEVEKITGRAAAYIESLIDNEEWGVIRELKTTAAETSAMTRWQQDIFGADLESFLTNIALFEKKRWETEQELEEIAALEKKAAEMQKASSVSTGSPGYNSTGTISNWTPSGTPSTNSVPVVNNVPDDITIKLTTNDSKRANNSVTVSTNDAQAGVNFVLYADKLDTKGKLNASQLDKALGKADAANISAGDAYVALAHTEGISWNDIGKAAGQGLSKKEQQAKAKEIETDLKAAGVSTTGTYVSTMLDKLKKGKYATGGLANFTGPAWLDGSPSKPELVLNAKDTKNFIALKDILSRVMKLQNSGDGSLSNANFEINVNVDHISSDYDVDKLTERIKRNIVKDASYRNVTQARRMR